MHRDVVITVSGSGQRKRFLKEHPLCCKCEEEGKYVRATIVDHIKPHRGDPILFWDEENWQPLMQTSSLSKNNDGRSVSGISILIGNTRQWWGYQISTNLLNIDRRPLKREFSLN